MAFWNYFIQSSYKMLHSTEMALMRVVNYIFLANYSGDPTISVLLDFISPFVIVDNNVSALSNGAMGRH